MPIGAVIGGAVIGAGASIGSGMMAADAQSDAAQTAADSSYATAQLNNQLYRDMWAQNYGVLAPYAQGGLPAMYLMNDMLGLTNYPVPAAPTPPGYAPVAPGTPTTLPATGGSALSGYSGTGTASQVGTGGGALSSMIGQTGAPGGIPINGMAPGGANRFLGSEATLPIMGPGSINSSTGQIAGAGGTTVGTRPSRADYRGDPQGFRSALGAYRAGQPAAGGTATGGAAGGASDPFATFRQGTNYQWRLGEGLNALRSGFAAHGALDSGAATKAAIKFNQNFASNELANYMNLLAGQQAMGLSAAGAVAGVGTTYAGNVAAQNTNAGNAAANAALIAGQGQANMWGGIGQGVGQIGGALTQYGMGQMMPQATYSPATSPIVVNPNNPGQSYWTGGW